MKKNSLIDLPAEEQYAAIEESIKDFIVSNDKLVIKEKISRNRQFKNDLGFDSLDFIRLVIHVENMYGISVPVSDIDNRLDTIDSLVKTFIKNIKK